MYSLFSGWVTCTSAESCPALSNHTVNITNWVTDFASQHFSELIFTSESFVFLQQFSRWLYLNWLVKYTELLSKVLPISSNPNLPKLLLNDIWYFFKPKLCTPYIYHIAALSRSCFFYIRQLRSISQSLTPDAVKTLVYAFVSSRIDYCNSIPAGVSGQLLQRLQSVQNAAARLVTGARRSDRMTPILRQLHWLPVRQRIIFKTAVLVYKYLHGMAPPYLSTYCELTSSHGGRRHLRSAESGQLIVPRMRTNYGDHSFAVHGPVAWKSLPADLRLLNISPPVFRKWLKIWYWSNWD